MICSPAELRILLSWKWPEASDDCQRGSPSSHWSLTPKSAWWWPSCLLANIWATHGRLASQGAKHSHFLPPYFAFVFWWMFDVSCSGRSRKVWNSCRSACSRWNSTKGWTIRKIAKMKITVAMISEAELCESHITTGEAIPRETWDSPDQLYRVKEQRYFALRSILLNRKGQTDHVSNSWC